MPASLNYPLPPDNHRAIWTPACLSDSMKGLLPALNGLCYTLAGLAAILYTGSGNPATGMGLVLPNRLD